MNGLERWLSPPVLLYVSAGDPRHLARVDSLKVPGIILDLEDSVVPAAKGPARDAAAAVVATRRTSTELWVRVNGLESVEQCWDDISAVTREGLAGLVVPKVDSARDLAVIDSMISVAEAKAGLEEGSIGVIPIVETVRSIDALNDIASFGRRIACLAIGAGDLSAELGMVWPEDPLAPNAVMQNIRARVILASRAQGLPAPHDAVYTRHTDQAGMIEYSRRARRMGFSGLHAIHPSQIGPIVQGLLPDDEEIATARRIVQLAEVARDEGKGNLAVDGQLVDRPIEQRAVHLLRRVESLAEVTSGQA